VIPSGIERRSRDEAKHVHRFIIVLLLLTMSPILGWAQSPYHWSKVRQGGKEEANTRVTGMNDAGWFVGFYHWLDGSGEGAFRFSKNKLIEFAIPGAESTWVEDIGASSTIVGNYFVPPPDLDSGDGTMYAFMYRHGLNTHLIIDVPGAFWTFPFAVNNKNKAGLGYFAEYPQDTVEWGAAIYDYGTKTFTPVTAFGEAGVVIEGLNDHLDMAGTVTVNDGCWCVVIPWVRWQGVDYELSLPSGARLSPSGINNDGVVVGSVIDESGVKGFKMSMKTGVWEVIEHPVNKGTWTTHIVDIANNGQMLASVSRIADGYTEGWWLRPTSKAKVAGR